MTYQDWVTAALRRPAILADLKLREWDVLLRQARRAGLLGRLAYMVEDHGLWSAIPDSPRQHLRSAAAMADKVGREVRWEVDRIHRALADVVDGVILLKGAAYVMAGLAPARGRIFQDVDILVPRAQLNEVESTLLFHGWAGVYSDRYDQRYYREWMHELPPVRHIERQAILDVHHTILPLTARLRPDADRLRAEAIGIPDHPGLKVLAPADMVLHSAVHLFYDGDFARGLRDLADMDALLRHFGTNTAFWSALLAHSHAHDLVRPLFYALHYCAKVLGTPLPPEFLEKVRAAANPGASTLRAMDWLLARGLRPDHPTCALPGSRLARQVLYVRSHWLRMPPLPLARHLFHKAFISKQQD
ncbi:MAG: nucleotidyltransferase family protein [Gammaproteobacteria bacterium]